MANYFSINTGNFTDSNTFGGVMSSFNFTQYLGLTGYSTILISNTASYKAPSMISDGKPIWGFAVHLSGVNPSTTSKLKMTLLSGGLSSTAVVATEVYDLSSFNSCNNWYNTITINPLIWQSLKLTTPVTMVSGTRYTYTLSASDANQIGVFANSSLSGIDSSLNTVLTSYGVAYVTPDHPFVNDTTYNTSLSYGGVAGNYVVSSSARALTGLATIEMWVKPTRTTRNEEYFIDTRGLAGTDGFIIGGTLAGSLANERKLFVYIKSGVNILSQSAPVSAINYNQWNHIAIVKNISSFTAYINGLSSFSYTTTATYSSWGMSGLIMGRAIQFGSIANVRIIDGYNLYPLSASSITGILSTQTYPTSSTAFQLDTSSIDFEKTVITTGTYTYNGFAGDTFHILNNNSSDNIDITLNQNVTANSIFIHKNASLNFPSNSNVNLTITGVSGIQITPKGTLNMGTSISPIAQSNTVNIVLSNTQIHVHDYGVFNAFGAYKKPSIYLSNDTGKTIYSITSNSSNLTTWLTGDNVLFMPNLTSKTSHEFATITSFPASDTFNINYNLLHNHYGFNNTPYLPTVFNLTRNAKIKGFNVSNRGYIKVLDSGVVSLSNVELSGMGLNETDKNPITIGTNASGSFIMNDCSFSENTNLDINPITYHSWKNDVYNINCVNNTFYSNSPYPQTMVFDTTKEYAWGNLAAAAGNYLGGPAYGWTSKQDYTFEFWVYPNEANVANKPIVCFGNNTAGTALKFMYGLAAGGTGLLFPNAAGTANSTLSTGEYITAFQWTHIAVVKSLSSIYYFVNGVLKNQQFADFSVPGGHTLMGDGVNSLKGYIKDFKFSHTAVYPVTSNFTLPTTPATPYGYIGRDQSIVDNVLSLVICDNNLYNRGSYSGNSYTTNGTGGLTACNLLPLAFTRANYVNYIYSPAIRFGYNPYSVLFNGTIDNITIPHNSSYNLSGKAFTLETWIHPYGSETLYDASRTIIAKRLGGGHDYIMYIVNDTASTLNGRLKLRFYNNEGGSSFTTLSSFNSNCWTHLAICSNGTSVSAYINGNFDSSSNFTVNSNRDYPLNFGRNDATNNSEYFFGSLSNFRLTNGTALYKASFTPSTKPLTGGDLLLFNSKTIVDNSYKKNTVMLSGNPIVCKTGPNFKVGYHNLNFYNNFILSAAGNGIEIESYNSDNSYIANNYIVTPKRSGVYISDVSITSGSIGGIAYYGEGYGIHVDYNSYADQGEYHTNTPILYPRNLKAKINGGGILTLKDSVYVDFSLRQTENPPITSGYAGNKYNELPTKFPKNYINDELSFENIISVSSLSSAIRYENNTQYFKYPSVLNVNGLSAKYSNRSVIEANNVFGYMTNISASNILGKNAIKLKLGDGQTTLQNLSVAGNYTNSYVLTTVAASGVDLKVDHDDHPFKNIDKYGSLYFKRNISTSYFTVSSLPPLTDFTFEFFAKSLDPIWGINNDGNNQFFIETRNSDTAVPLIIGLMGRSGLGEVGVYNGNWNYSTTNSVSSLHLLKVNEWFHVAVCRSSGIISTYINGVSSFAFADANIVGGWGNKVWFGRYFNPVSNNSLSGKMANIRICNYAVYSGASFEVPKNPVGLVPGTCMLYNYPYNNYEVQPDVGLLNLKGTTSYPVSIVNSVLSGGLPIVLENTNFDSFTVENTLINSSGVAVEMVAPQNEYVYGNYIFNNCKFPFNNSVSSRQIAQYQPAKNNNGVIVNNPSLVPAYYKFSRSGTINSDSVRKFATGAKLSEKITPYSNDKIKSGSKLIPLNTGDTITVGVSIYKSAISASDAYNYTGDNPRLMLKSNYGLGFSETVLATFDSGNGVWSTKTATLPSSKGTGIVEIYVDCSGVGNLGSINVDKWTLIWS